MAIEYDDGQGNKGTVKCPLLRVEAMRVRHLLEFTGKVGAVEDGETDCIGDQCGSYFRCKGKVLAAILEPDFAFPVVLEPKEGVRDFRGQLIVSQGRIEDIREHFKKNQSCNDCGQMVYVCKSGKMGDHRLGRGKKLCPNTSYTIVQ